MDVTILGGTEIGATCIWCKTASTQWLIDAGVRMNERDTLPNLGHLDAHGAAIDGIFVTHAHQDHIGALPLVSAMYPDAPVFMTQATLQIARVMLADALKLSEQDGHARVFSDTQLENLWQRVRVMGQDKVFGWRGVRISTYSAGHILGAVAIGFETEREGSLLFTGDFSSAPSRLIGGLRIPRGTSFDMVVTESTYGTRLHESRAEQERALAEQVAGVISSGGFVLIPAFAVGRAQEILMILQDAMRYNKSIKPFTIVVDGLVRSICPIYESYPQLLQGPAKRLLRTSGRLFSPDDIRFVKTAEQRQQVVTGPPCCIVSSSGMLTGGPSVYYANTLVPNPANGVFLCGYQDEESPGRLLLDMARQAEADRKWILPDRVVPVRAQVGFYGLSAHADKRELLQNVADLRPHQVLLVHGDQEAKNALRQAMMAVMSRTDVHLAEIARCYTVEPRHKSVGRPFQVPTSEQPLRAARWNHHVLLVRHEGQLRLGICQRTEGGSVTVRDGAGDLVRVPVGLVMESFGPIPGGEESGSFLRGLWQAAEACLVEQRLFGYRPAERLAYAIAEQRGLLVPAQPFVSDEVQALLDPYGWREMKPDDESRVFQVYVSFPWAVPGEVLAQVHALEADGWRYHLQPHIYPVAVNQLLQRVAAEFSVTIATPKIYPQEHRILVPVLGQLDEDQRRALGERIEERTGGSVVIQVMVSADPITAVQAHGERMEQNEALRRVKQEIPATFLLQKAGLEPLLGVIRLTVAFPDVVMETEAAREFVLRMEAETGWRLEWQTTVNQALLASVAVTCVQERGGNVRTTPSLLLQRRSVRVTLTAPLDPAAADAAADDFRSRTGWVLELDGIGGHVGPQAAGNRARAQASAHAGRDALTETASPALRAADNAAGRSRMEINRAMQWMESKRTARGIEVYRKSLRGDAIELTFITPEFGSWHADWLDELAQDTGWAVRVADKVQQQALISLAESMCHDYVPMKTPSVFLDKRQVGVRTEQPIPQSVVSAFHETTAWLLVSG